MKTIITAFLVFFWALAGNAQLYTSKEAIIAALKDSKIEMLVIENATFEEALDQIQKHWHKQHPEWSFPVATTDYKPADGMRAERPPLISLKLKNVPFLTALRYLGDSSKRRLGVSPGLLRMEEVAWIEEDFYSKAYPVTSKILEALHLTATSSPNEVAEAYRAYGVALDTWMNLRIVGDTIEVLGYDREHHQVAGINILLESGFEISKKDPNKAEMATPRKPSD
jgi:hypothetical protein